MEIPHVNFVGVQGLQGCHKIQAQTLWGVITQLALISRTAHPRMRIVLGVHDQTPVLPVDFSEIFFTGAECINACSVDLIVPMALKDVEDSFDVFEFMNSSAFRSFYAKRHSTHYDLQGAPWADSCRHGC